MSVQGLCQVCEAAPAEHRCPRCGLLVCASHYDRARRLCTACATRVGPGDESE
ncbi:MAG: zinc finger HIT domain-containing protein [Halobacteriales archaeon]